MSGGNAAGSAGPKDAGRKGGVWQRFFGVKADNQLIVRDSTVLERENEFRKPENLGNLSNLQGFWSLDAGIDRNYLLQIRVHHKLT